MDEITLRAIEYSDMAMLQRWRNSPGVMPYCRQYRPLTQQDMLQWYELGKKESDYNLTNDLFIIEYNNKAIGVGGFVRIDWRNRKGELSFYIGTHTENTKKMVGLALSALLEYAFKTLGLHKIIFPCYSFNPNIPTYKETLTEEYTAKEEYYWDGKFWDRIILVAYKEK